MFFNSCYKAIIVITHVCSFNVSLYTVLFKSTLTSDKIETSVSNNIYKEVSSTLTVHIILSDTWPEIDITYQITTVINSFFESSVYSSGRIAYILSSQSSITICSSTTNKIAFTIPFLISGDNHCFLVFSLSLSWSLSSDACLASNLITLRKFPRFYEFLVLSNCRRVMPPIWQYATQSINLFVYSRWSLFFNSLFFWLRHTQSNCL